MRASLPEEYRVAREGAAYFNPSAGLIVVSGRDRASYLQGLLTNDTAALAPGTGCYSAYLTPQGRMIADLWVHELGDVILLRMQPVVKDAVLARLDQFIFSEDVRLGDVTSSFGAAAVVGPHAPAVVALTLGVNESVLPPPGEGSSARLTFNGESVIAVRPTSLGLSGIELLLPGDHLPALHTALQARGALDIDAGTADLLRVEAGVPLFGVDMDHETIPLEAGIESRAISFTKGCYVGQEVIIRVLHRGHGRVARRLVGLVFDAGQPVPAGTLLRADGKDAGSVTSGVMSPALQRPIALAYLKRDVAAPGSRVVTADGVSGDVVALPFVR
jgi:folate-binding protein YgfZ